MVGGRPRKSAQSLAMKESMNLASALTNAPALDDYFEYLESSIEADGGHSVRAAVIPAAFALFEAHPDAEFGMPGPLVHYLEAGYPDYCGELVASLGRCPTAVTLWMANRILNGSPPEDLTAQLVGCLEAIERDGSASDALRDSAREFLEFQRQ